MKNQKDFPYHFNDAACSTCLGNCCRGISGNIWITLEELETLANEWNIDLTTFYWMYTRVINGKLSLQERAYNGEFLCCFFDPIECCCTIYQNRPEQCRNFPFWDYFKGEIQELLDECPGVTLK